MSFEQFEEIARQSLFILILFLEFYGTIVIFLSASKIMLIYVRYRKGNKKLRLNFARHIALGLEFLLAAEIIRTITVRTWDELIILLVILLMRAFIAGLILWEIKQEHKLEGPD